MCTPVYLHAPSPDIGVQGRKTILFQKQHLIAWKEIIKYETDGVHIHDRTFLKYKILPSSGKKKKKKTP